VWIPIISIIYLVGGIIPPLRSSLLKAEPWDVYFPRPAIAKRENRWPHDTQK
jgi:hypothetical protein